MPSSSSSSSGSLPCHIEWRPSRWLCVALILLAMLAAFAITASEMPPTAAWPLALLALAYGLWLAARHHAQPVRRFVFNGQDGPVLVDGLPVEEASVTWRGALAFVRWNDATGRTWRMAWWPDTLPAPLRRELRLAAPLKRAARKDASVAT